MCSRHTIYDIFKEIQAFEMLTIVVGIHNELPMCGRNNTYGI